MEIFIEQNGEQLGPYSIDEATTLLSNGTLSRGDVAWVGGGAPRRTLGDLVGKPAPALKTSIPAPQKVDSVEVAVSRGIIRALLILAVVGALLALALVLLTYV